MKKLRALVADDDQTVRGFLTDVLSRIFGCETDEATSAAQAAEKTASGSFDFVLIDGHLSDGTLEDYCKLLSGSGDTVLKIPKWLITGERPTQWNEARMKSFGVLGYMVKPCRIDDLQTVLKKQFPGSVK